MIENTEFPAAINRDHFASYISGFVDGKGCFTLYMGRDKRRTVPTPHLCFAIRPDDINILRLIQLFWEMRPHNCVATKRAGQLRALQNHTGSRSCWASYSAFRPLSIISQENLVTMCFGGRGFYYFVAFRRGRFVVALAGMSQTQGKKAMTPVICEIVEIKRYSVRCYCCHAQSQPRRSDQLAVCRALRDGWGINFTMAMCPACMAKRAERNGLDSCCRSR